MIRLVAGVLVLIVSVGSIEISEFFPMSDDEYTVWLCLLAVGISLVAWGGISLAEPPRLRKNR